MLTFGILGPIEVHDRRGRRLSLDGRMQLGLLAFLVLNANRAVSSDQLLDAIWGQDAPGGGLKKLHVAVARLRRALREDADDQPSIIRTTAGGYLLEVGPGSLDAETFEARSGDGRRALADGDPARAGVLLREALAMWRGPALAEVAYEGFAQAEIRRLDELRLAALEARLEADLRRGRHADLIGELEGAVVRHPARERLVGRLMLALYRTGRQGDALDAYQRARAALSTELGLEPGPALKALQERILEHAASLDLAPTDPPPATPTRRPTATAPRLPARPADLLGREADAQAVIELLRREHVGLLSITGVGGVGKTALAVDVAHRLAGEFAHGAAFVDLSAVSDPSEAAEVMLRVLGATPDPGATATETLARVIVGREQLLVLDSFEHLVAGAPLLATMLEAAPSLKLLVTSRAALHLRAEHCYLLEPLDLPQTHDPAAVSSAPATALFIARAAAQGPARHMTAARADAIATVCARLDGLPLAIELAATRCSVLSPEEIAHRLDRVLPSLGTGARDAPERHRTLRATLDWSFELLGADDQLAFSQLSCFTGGFGLEAVAAVCHEGGSDQALDTLARLAEVSLIQVAEHDGSTRYRLLETVREYAADRLGADEPVRRRHMAHYLALAERGEPHLTGSGQAEWLARLESERGNLRTALESALSFCDAQTSLRLAGALVWFWYLHGHYREGRDLLNRALAAESPAPAPARAKGLKGGGTLAFLMCEYARATDMLGSALSLYRELDDRRGVASSLQVLGSVARERGDYTGAAAFHEESLSLWRELDDPTGIARSLTYLAFAAWLVTDYDRAQTLSTETLERFRRLGDNEGIAWSLMNLAATALHRGDLTVARARCTDALALSRKMAYTEGVAWSLNLLGAVAEEEGDAAGAAAHLEESLAAHMELGDRWRVAGVLEAVAGLLDDPLGTARLFGAGEALREAIGAPIPECDRAGHQRNVCAARHSAEPELFAAAWSHGRAMSIEEAVAQARAALAGVGDRRPPGAP